jgi:nucleotide-binding universal stress UspA family protein
VAEAQRRIVVGYDGSTAAHKAVAYAARTAGKEGCVLVVHAFGPPASPGVGRNFAEAIVRHRRHGAELLEALTGIPDGPLAGVKYELLLTGGSPAEQLLQAARRHSAEQIVVGSRGVGPLMAALGSVSHELLYITDRPVAVIPAGENDVNVSEPESRAEKETVG